MGEQNKIKPETISTITEAKKKKGIRHKPFAFKLGDNVHISHLRSAFQREYDVKWYGEIFKISKRFLQQGQPVYKLIDWFSKPLKGTFYQKELQKANLKRGDPQKIEKNNQI